MHANSVVKFKPAVHLTLKGQGKERLRSPRRLWTGKYLAGIVHVAINTQILYNRDKDYMLTACNEKLRCKYSNRMVRMEYCMTLFS